MIVGGGMEVNTITFKCTFKRQSSYFKISNQTVIVGGGMQVNTTIFVSLTLLTVF